MCSCLAAQQCIDSTTPIICIRALLFMYFVCNIMNVLRPHSYNKHPSPITGNAGSGQGRRRRKFTLIPVDRNHKPPGRRDLVYFEDSPSFCDNDKLIGNEGTTGRECNDTSIGVDGCDIMCCGRGYKSESYTVKERCSCTFHWCCNVKCETCTRTRLQHTCS